MARRQLLHHIAFVAGLAFTDVSVSHTAKLSVFGMSAIAAAASHALLRSLREFVSSIERVHVYTKWHAEERKDPL